MVNVWMISDTHFFHENIINYESRPFSSVEEMNDEMIRRWNNKVSKDDKVFILGDFALGSKDDITSIVKRLKGYKVLIRGNHDRSRKAMLEAGFDEVYDYPIIYKGFFFLSHEPMYINKHMPYVNIHGHLHSTKMEGDCYYNVSVENHDYSPVNFLDIQKLYIKEDKE